MSGYQNSGLTREEFEDRQALHAAIAVVERRWPDSGLLRELREQAEAAGGEAEKRRSGPMVDLARWLGQQLDEDERVALAATQHRWIVSERKTPASADSPSGDPFWVAADEGFGAPVFQFKDKRDAEFIAAWDPARVLREIDAKRGIVARYEFARHEAAALNIGEEERKTRIASAAAFQSCVLLIAGTFEDRPGYAEAIASVE